jgi:hypothetical protein
MSLMILLTLSLASLAAFTEQDAKNQAKVAQAAAASADGELPPCEGHDHFEDVMRRLVPSSACPKAKAYFEAHLEVSRRIRDNCRETTRWAEDQLRNPEYCKTEKGQQAALKKISQLKRLSQAGEDSEDLEKAEKLLDDPALAKYLDDETPPTPGKGEWAQLECVHAVKIAMQFRMRQRNLANKHFGMADNAISSVCEEGPKGAEDYLNFLRGGEDAL